MHAVADFVTARLLLIFACGVGVPLASRAAAEAPCGVVDDEEPSFEQMLCILQHHKFRTGTLTEKQKRGYRGEAEALFDQRFAVPDIYQLWLAGDRHFVELQWWKKDDRLTRFFVLMLFYAQVGEEGEAMSNFPDFAPQRFAQPERDEREEEIALVKKYRSALAAELAKIFPKARFAQIAASRMGDPLSPGCLDVLRSGPERSYVQVTADTNRDSLVGQWVDVSGRVSNTKIPCVLGLCFADADVPEDPRTKMVRLRGLVRREVMAQADFDAAMHDPRGAPAMHGPGVTYWLTHVQVLSIAK